MMRSGDFTIGDELYKANIEGYEQGYKDRLIDINEIIVKEIEVAKKINPQMAMGMLQIKKLLNKD